MAPMETAMHMDGQFNEAAAADLSEDERTWGLFVHLSTVVSITVFPVVPGLIMYFVKRNQSHYMRDTAAEVLNFQISVLLYMIIAGILMMVIIGIPLMLAAYALAIFGLIKGTIAGSKGHYFRYPMCLRFVR
jgi:uncharacterized Tic20 family protein